MSDSQGFPEGYLFRYADAEFMERGGAVRSAAIASPATGAQRVLVGMTEIPVGGEIPLHTHNTEECVLVLSGQARVTIEERQEDVGPLDATVIVAGLRHRFVNSGSEPLRILWVYGDPNTTRTLMSTGETFGHLSPYPAS